MQKSCIERTELNEAELGFTAGLLECGAHHSPQRLDIPLHKAHSGELKSFLHLFPFVSPACLFCLAGQTCPHKPQCMWILILSPVLILRMCVWQCVKVYSYIFCINIHFNTKRHHILKPQLSTGYIFNNSAQTWTVIQKKKYSCVSFMSVVLSGVTSNINENKPGAEQCIQWLYLSKNWQRHRLAQYLSIDPSFGHRVNSCRIKWLL